jgi:hypothetical protein
MLDQIVLHGDLSTSFNTQLTTGMSLPYPIVHGLIFETSFITKFITGKIKIPLQ